MLSDIVHAHRIFIGRIFPRHMVVRQLRHPRNPGPMAKDYQSGEKQVNESMLIATINNFAQGYRVSKVVHR